MSDYLLRDAVERAIQTYAPIRTSDTDIKIDVTGKEVTLHGYVRTDSMRAVATQLARGVQSGLTVRNHLLSDSDLEILAAQTIELKLGSYVVPMMPIVRVIMGHCFLRGPVPSDKAKELIAQTAAKVPGIAFVSNELVVDPAAIERLIAPKKAAKAAKGGAASGGQAMVGGKPVTEADLPSWAMKAKSAWSLADYKTRAKAKMAFKRNEGADPKEMEEAGAILRGGNAAEEAEPEPEAAAPVAEAASVDTAEEAEETVVAASAPVDMAALQSQFPAWALKAKEEWDNDDFKGQMAAKRAFKQGAGEDPNAIIEKAQAAVVAAQSGGTTKKKSGSKDPKAAALEAVRQQFPGWAIVGRKEWSAQDFTQAADARIAELNGKGQPIREIRVGAQSALEAALRGEAVGGAGGAKRRDLTPDEIAAVRANLGSEYPMWALKAKEEWDNDDFKGQMAAKRAAKSGGGEAPEAVIEKAQAALQAALKEAHEALPLEGGAAAPAAAPVADGKKEIPAELFDKYPGWALKPKEEWSGDEFKANAKAKSAFKKGEGPSPDATIAEAQAAIG